MSSGLPSLNLALTLGPPDPHGWQPRPSTGIPPVCRGHGLATCAVGLVLCALAGLSAHAGELQALAGDRIVVRHHPGDARLARSVHAICKAHSLALSRALGLSARQALEVILARSEQEFNERSAGALPEWALAVALPGRSRIVVKAWLIAPGVTNNLAVTMRHEHCHVLMRQAEVQAMRVPGAEPLPLWFHEGVAVWVSAVPVPGARRQFKIAAGQDALIPFRDLARAFPADRHRAALAYQQSVSFIEFIAARCGEDAVPRILAQYQRLGTLGAAVRAVTGSSLSPLERTWRKKHRSRHPLLRLVIQSLSLFTLMALLCIAAFFIVRRRRRRALAEWEAEDQPFTFHPGGGEWWGDDEE